jgi:hypothetical protein
MDVYPLVGHGFRIILLGFFFLFGCCCRVFASLFCLPIDLHCIENVVGSAYYFKNAKKARGFSSGF